MLQHKFILPPTIGNKAFGDASESKNIHITLCNAPGQMMSELLLKLAELFEKQSRTPFVFFDYFNENRAICLQCENMVISSEKADGFFYKNRIFADVEAKNSTWKMKSKNADLCEESQVQFSKAQEYMKIARRAALSRSSIVSPNFNAEKASAAIERLAREKVKKHCSSGRTSSAGICEIESAYNFYSGTHLSFDKTLLPCYIRDRVYSKELFMGLVNKQFGTFDRIILRDVPMGECVGMIIPKAGLAFIPFDEKEVLLHDKTAEDYKIFNLERFVDTRLIKEQKAELKFLSKCITELCDSGLKCLACANSLCEKPFEEDYVPGGFDITANALSISRFCNSHFN